MAYGYYSKRYSYQSPAPSDLDSASVKELIKLLKLSIDNGKLRDLKSALSKLKLAINESFPTFTNELAPFGAYIYAVKSGNKKSSDSIFKALIKKNFTFDGLPILKMINNFSKSDFRILLKDYFLNTDAKFNLEGSETIKEMFELYPKETEKMIMDDRLNKFAKGEERTNSATTIIKNCKNFDTIIKTLKTFFDFSYVQQFGMKEDKLIAIRNALNEQSKDIIKKVLKFFFYITYLKYIPIEMFVKDAQDNLLDEQAIENYTIQQFRVSNYGLIEILSKLKDDNLRVRMVTTNNEISEYVAKTKPDLLPDSVKDIFLF